MKLYKLLFENISEDDVLKAIFDMLKSNTETTRYIKAISDAGRKSAVRYFYSETKNEWDKILNNATSIEHLGGGAKGNAFSVKTKDKNFILKLELEEPLDTDFSSKKRATIASTALFSIPKTRKTKNTKIAAAVPMIYDQGSMIFPKESSNEISWTLMEKFETIEGPDQYNLNDLIEYIVDEFYNGTPLKDIKNINKPFGKQPDYIKGLIKSLSISLNLKDNWFDQLVTHMHTLNQAGITDFHAGNIGVRRSGAEGTLVFFD